MITLRDSVGPARSLRIAYIVSSYYPRIGGVETHVRQLAQGCAEAGDRRDGPYPPGRGFPGRRMDRCSPGASVPSDGEFRELPVFTEPVPLSESPTQRTSIWFTCTATTPSWGTRPSATACPWSSHRTTMAPVIRRSGRPPLVVPSRRREVVQGGRCSHLRFRRRTQPGDKRLSGRGREGGYDPERD